MVVQVSSLLQQTPWVCSVAHIGGMYFVLEPLLPAICST